AQNETTFKFRINQRENVSIDLFDNNGKQVKRLVQKEFLPGLHEEKVSLSGILAGHYIYTLQAGFYHESKKLVIL
ncbi:MAG: T9SS type A sorting domain-containing protein, partial [Chryseotalea sp.]